MTLVVRNVMALRLEFVARPERSGAVSGGVCEMLRLESLAREGFLSVEAGFVEGTEPCGGWNDGGCQHQPGKAEFLESSWALHPRSIPL